MKGWTPAERNKLEQMMEATGLSKYEAYEHVAKALGRSLESVRQQWAKIRGSGAIVDETSHRERDPLEPGRYNVVRTFSADDMRRITNLDELIGFFDVDLDLWDISHFRVNSWEQKPGVALYQVRAVFTPKPAFHSEEEIAALWAEFIEDVRAYASPEYLPVERGEVSSTFVDEPCMAVVAIYDPHIGMLAWGKECGTPYDLDLAAADYTRAACELHRYLEPYPIENIRYVVGHDLFHADTLAEGGKGATTTKGTMQDIDTRLSKIFTRVRRAVVGALDEYRLIAPTKVVVVPGNHDAQTTYKFGEVLSAWYRNDEEVEVDFGPSKRRYDLYGNTVFLHTHGEEFRRKRDNLVSVFATECPPEMWAAAKYREVLVGHNHINMRKVYTGDPLEVEWEGRATNVRSLPGLTPEDAWHYEAGYKHTRAATLIIYRRSGGIAGLHQFVL